jgi:hypothetical protein
MERKYLNLLNTVTVKRQQMFRCKKKNKEKKKKNQVKEEEKEIMTKSKEKNS